MSEKMKIMRLAGERQRTMPRKLAFTVRTLAGVKVPQGRDRTWVYDSRTPNLGYMLTARGVGAFYWVGRAGGRPIRYRLGGAEIGIENARRLAAAVAADVARGIDPQGRRQEARADLSFGELFQWYLENHAKARKRTWREDEQKYERHLRDWAARRASSITRADVARLHARIGAKRPGAANRTLALISSVFNRARDLGLTAPNPAQGIRRFPEHKRERFLGGEELGRFYKALAREDQDWQDFFALLLLTGARRGNLQSATWEEIDLDGATWTIPAEKFKTARVMVVPLVRDAVEILRRRRQQQADAGGGGYVFPSARGEGHLIEPRKAWRRICSAADLRDLRIHDLRRTMGSWQAATGANLSVIGKSLGHANISTTAIYARLDLAPVREAVERAVAAMKRAGH